MNIRLLIALLMATPALVLAQSPEFELHYAYDYNDYAEGDGVALGTMENGADFSGNITLGSSKESGLSYTGITPSGEGTALDVSQASFTTSNMKINESTGYLFTLQFYLPDGVGDGSQIMSFTLGKKEYEVSMCSAYLTISGGAGGDLNLELAHPPADEWMTLILYSGAALTGDNNVYDIGLFGEDGQQLTTSSFRTEGRRTSFDGLSIGGYSNSLYLDNLAIYDGVPDTNQYDSLVSQMSDTGEIPTDFELVPEPSTVIMSSMALLALARRRRR